jgi:hypothetical protein
MRRICSRYWSGPSAKLSSDGKCEVASGNDSAWSSIWRSVPSCSRVICSSKRECMTIAGAPASSRRFTMSRSSTSGDAPGMIGLESGMPM